MKLKLLLVALALGSVANAAILIESGNNPPSPVYNLLFAKGMTGTTVTGTFDDLPGLNGVFTSTQVLVAESNGQARLTAGKQNLISLTLSLAGGYTFGGVVFALNRPNGKVPNPTYTIVATGTSNSQTQNGSVTAGNQFFTIVAMDEELKSVTLASSGLDDIRQVRFFDITAPGSGGEGGGGGGAGGGGAGGEIGSEIPEVSTLLMLGSSLFAVSLGRRFRDNPSRP